MMSMHKLVAGDGYAYLTRQVAAGDAGLGPGVSLTAYYEATGNPAGRWYGAGLAGLGGESVGLLSAGDRVTEEAMAAAFRDGHDPLTGEPLGRSFQSERAVVGFDLAFTALKSVSVLWGLADDATRATVYSAHRAALDQSLAFVERTVIRTRVGEGGCRQVRTRGMIAAAFDHWDTRAGGPNLHTHVVLANKVQGPDGCWRSLDGKSVYAAVVTVSELYDTLLADELARRLPVAFSRRDRGPRRNPAFELDGVGDDVLAMFSARAEQIHCAEMDWAATFTATHGRAPSRVETTRARQHLARATRPPKIVRPVRELFAEWANRARALTGIEPIDLAARALAGAYGRPLHSHDVGPEVRAAVVAQILQDVSTKRSVWTTWNLGAAALRASRPLRMADPEERLRLLNDLTGQAAAACVHLDDTRDPERRRVGESLFTSTELLAAEKTLIDATTIPAHLPRTIEGIELHDGLLAGVGDRIVTRHNHRRLHTPDGFVRNGALWDIVAMGPDGSLDVHRADAASDSDLSQAVVRLPANYVAEHVELGYATTTARVQGITVDQTHTIAAPGMAREDLYVGMSRGRDLNRVYVVTDATGDECRPDTAAPARSALEVLREVLATSHAEQSATETWDTYHPDEPPPIPPVHPRDDGMGAPRTAPPTLSPPSRYDVPVIERR